MKQLTEYNRVSGYLNKIFNLLNEKYFESALSKPVITIQSTRKVYGHVSVRKVWNDGSENRHELNIGAGTLNRPIENVVCTMLHEMVHLYCLQNGIKDTSRGGTYHNKNFKREAEKRDLIIDYIDSIGYSKTSPSDNILQFCLQNELDEIKVHRYDDFSSFVPPSGSDVGNPVKVTVGKAKKPSSTRKYVCPCCGASVRATREISLICGACFNPDDKSTIYYLEQV